MTQQDNEHAAFEAQIELPPLPITPTKDAPDQEWHLTNTMDWQKNGECTYQPLYTQPIAPQPALDAADLAFIANELRLAGKNRAADLVMTAMAVPPATQPAEPVRERLETTSEHIARDIREGRFPDKSERQTVPAEPVKVPPEKSDPWYEEGSTEVFDHAQRQAYVDGWNACREAMLKGQQGKES